MNIRSWQEFVPGPNLRDWAATIGVFDGMHLGHQKLIRQITSEKESSLVVTFRKNPKAVLRPDSFSGNLMLWESKLEFWEASGIDEVLWIDFSPEFSKMTGIVFFENLLQRYRLKRLVLGWNFSFGRDASTKVHDICSWASKTLAVEVVAPVQLGGRIVSSSSIRQAIRQGDMNEASRLLGRPYSLVIPENAGHEGGVSSVPLSKWQQVLPKTGIYRVCYDGRKGLLNVAKDIVFWESPPGTMEKEIVFEE